jgi:hypothetical protein
MDRPGAPFSTRKALRPREPAAGSVRAQTTNRPAWLPLVIHCLAPEIR